MSSEPTAPDSDIDVPPEWDEPILTAEGIDVTLGGVDVLRDVDLSVGSGELVGLVGPNGAGKTTLLRTLRATLSPDAGTIRIAGEPLATLSARRIGRLVASVPQDTGLAFSFTVRQTVEMGRTPHVGRFGTHGPEDREAIERAMDRTAVSAFADRPITDVSGGERQRVLLARALAQETPVLLLDEPTASLDINHAVRTLELVRELVDEGKAAVAAIHDLNLAARYCDSLVLLSGGEVLATGPPEAVLTRRTLRKAFGARAVVTRQPATDAPLVTALADGEDRSGRVHVIGHGPEARRVLAALAAAGFEVSVGAVHDGDVAAEAAREFDGDAVTVPAFGTGGETVRAELREAVAAADAVVVTDDLVGPNREAVAAADAPVVRVDGMTSGSDSPSEKIPKRLVDAVAELIERE